MTPRKQKRPSLCSPGKTPKRVWFRSVESMPVINPHAAGIDVHSNRHWVAVPGEVRTFGTCTADLELLADWLQACGITSVALESTGVYWIPLFEVLERRGLVVHLIDAWQTKQAPGRPKTDCIDCQWIQRLHSCGLLTPSFRPADQVVVLRSYLRQRQMLIQYAGQHIQHMQKALEQMNVKLTEVLNDVTGVTGMAIIKALIDGERDPVRLAKLRNFRCKHTEEQIARALQGTWRAEHLLALKQAVDLYEYYRVKLRECDEHLQAHLETFADRSQGKRLAARTCKRRRPANEPLFDVRQALYRMSGVDLTVLEGIDANTALVILSEIGMDMSKWRTEKHFTAWLGLCPQHQGSGGKIKSRRIRRGANRAARALRMAGQACHHAKNAMGAFYRRIQARAGAPKAVVATARKIATRIYRLLKYGLEYVRQEMDAYEEAYRQRVIASLARKARELGYQLQPTST